MFWQVWLTFLDHTDIVVTSLTAGFLLYTRSAAVFYFVSGAVFCSRSVKLIKKVIRQPRPPVNHQGRQKSSYGMPSTHSATISFYVTYIVSASFYLPIHSSLPSGRVSRILPVIISVPWAAMILMSRVWLGHHTWPQVFAGSAYGVAVALGWFKLWTSGMDLIGKEAEQIVNSWLLNSIS